MNSLASDMQGLSQVDRTWKVEVLIAVLAAVLAVALMWGTLWGIITILATLVLAALRVSAALYFFVFFLPFAPVIETQLPIRDVFTFLRIALVVGISLGCFFSKKSVREWLLSLHLNWVVFSYAFIALVSVLVFNQVTSSSQHALFRLLSYLSFYFAVTALIESRGQLRRAINVLLLSTVMVSLFGIYQAVIGDYSDFYFRVYPLQEEGIPPWTGRVSSFLFHFNSLAGYLNLVLPFALALSVLSRRSATRCLAGACFALGSITLVLTQSRGGLIAYVGTLLLGILLLTNDARKRVRLLALLAVGIPVAMLIIGSYAERLSGVDEFETSHRLMLFGGAVNMFLSSPIIGVGYGNFRELYATLVPGAGPEMIMIDSHNLYLQLLSETGIVGFVAFLVVVFGMVRLALRQVRDPQSSLDQVLGFGALAAMVTVLIHGFVDFLFITSPQFGALFWLVLGLLVANERVRSRREIPQLSEPSSVLAVQA